MLLFMLEVDGNLSYKKTITNFSRYSLNTQFIRHIKKTGEFDSPNGTTMNL
jgi:hypothetical protein